MTMTTLKLKTFQELKNRCKALAKDTRGGSEMVQFIILVVAVALFCLAAFQEFGSAVSDRTKKAAQEIPKIEGKQ